MKTISILAATMLFTACVSYTPITSFIDYSSFYDSGVYLTEANSVNFDYEPVGSINVLVYQGKGSLKELKNPMKNDDIYYSVNKSDGSVMDAFSIAVELAKEQGANAIINLKYELFKGTSMGPDGWLVSGMAIKK